MMTPVIMKNDTEGRQQSGGGEGRGGGVKESYSAFTPSAGATEVQQWHPALETVPTFFLFLVLELAKEPWKDP